MSFVDVAPFLCIHTEAILRDLIGLVVVFVFYGIVQVVAYEMHTVFPRSGLLAAWIIVLGVILVQGLRLLSCTLADDH